MKKSKIRFLSCLLAVMLCFTAFATTAFAGGGDYYDELNGDAISTPEPTPESAAPTETPDETEAPAHTNAEDMAELLSALLGTPVEVKATGDGLQIIADGAQTGTVTTNGGKLNVRTGAGLDNTAFTQLPNGTEVEVLGTENGWVKVRLPEREGYVCGDYLTIHGVESGGLSLSLDEDELAALFGLFGSATSGNHEALTPDGNLTLVDDIGSTGSGKQFITLQSKNGNVFYLIIDRDDEGAETVHFLNQVDEADLLALTEDGEIEPEVCNCTDKCTVGTVNTACPVCAVSMAECAGKEAQPEAEETPETEPERGNSTGVLLVVLLLAAAGGGAAYYFLKVKKNKPQTKGSTDLDDYDYGEDDEDELDVDYVDTEDEAVEGEDK